MYYTGIDPRTMEKVYVPKSYEEKQMQRALLQYRDPKNYSLVKKALMLAGRTDLIGYSEKCLIKPDDKNNYNKEKSKGDNKNGKNFKRKGSFRKSEGGYEKRNNRASGKRH